MSILLGEERRQSQSAHWLCLQRGCLTTEKWSAAVPNTRKSWGTEKWSLSYWWFQPATYQLGHTHTTAPENSPEQRFLDAISDAFLTQHVKEHTCMRGNNRPSTLDLIITKDQNSIENKLSPMGKHDHCVILLYYVYQYQMSQENGRRDLNYFKGN